MRLYFMRIDEAFGEFIMFYSRHTGTRTIEITASDWWAIEERLDNSYSKNPVILSLKSIEAHI